MVLSSDDKKSIIAKYNKHGYRDAKIIFDTVYTFDDKTINIDIKIDPGRKYYFRNITWVGNTKYSSEYLSDALGINKKKERKLYDMADRRALSVD